MPDPIIESLIQDYRARAEMGIQKYGTDLTRQDIDRQGWIQHLREELMDATAYLKRLEIEPDHFQDFLDGMRSASLRFRGRDLESEQARLAQAFYESTCKKFNE